jgi:hypothetical protein
MQREEYLQTVRSLMPPIAERAFRDVHAVRAHATNNPDKGAMLYSSLELAVEGEDKKPIINFI